MSDALPIALLAAALVLLVLVTGLAQRSMRRRLAAADARCAELEQQLLLVRQSISGLTAGAVGVDRRVRGLEQRARVLSERQETYENQQADEQPYSHAIRLVQQGASAHRLVQELAIGESEAELIVRLHGQRVSA